MTRTLKYAANCTSWAIGRQQPNGFHVRRIVWGLLLAQHEVREGEEIRGAMIQVERAYKPRRIIR